jgi:hypothetical protein
MSKFFKLFFMVVVTTPVSPMTINVSAACDQSCQYLFRHGATMSLESCYMLCARDERKRATQGYNTGQHLGNSWGNRGRTY